MKFEITRSSCHRHEKPCDGVVGIEHVVEFRDSSRTEVRWTIEISSLEDLLLMTQVSDWRSLVIEPTDVLDCVARVEIYDAYRE
jgi:hypothetical protein